jgi:nucleotide-binding universal stress UspA family protein
MTFETVVVPIDGSTLSRRAVPAAAAIAAGGRADVRLVSVAHNDGELAWSYDQVHEAAELLPSDMTSRVDVLVDGDPAGVLLDIAEDPSNVLCFGTHDHHWLATELLGRVGSRIVERASHPFLVVGGDGVPPVPKDDVVVAIDGVEDPTPLLSTAVTWAQRLGAGLRIVTVYEPTPADLRRPDHYLRRLGPPCDPDVYLDAVRRGIDDSGLTSCTTVAIPDPVSVAAGLEQHLAEHPAFLLVIGGARRRHWPTSVLRDLLHGSVPPILVVR